MNNLRLSFLVLIAGSFLSQACSKDRNLEDYKKELLTNSLARIQAVQGRYSGYAVSKNDKSNLGAMVVTLRPTTQVSPSKDETKSSAQPLLAVNVEFQGESHMTMTVKDSYFDTESGHFQADIPVQQTNSQGQVETKTVTINGFLRNGKLEGTLEAIDYANYGITFSLSSQGPSLESLAKDGHFPRSIFTKGSYIGSTLFANGTSKAVNMILLKATTTSENDFLNLLLPVKPVELTLNYGNGAHLVFTNGNWDQRVGKLTGQTKLTKSILAPNGNTITQNVDLSLACQITSENGFKCDVNSSSAADAVATIAVSPNDDGRGVPPDSSTTRDAVTKKYLGVLELGSNERVPSKFAVTYAARSRLDEITDLYFPQVEKNVVVNLTFGSVGLTFSTVKWDSNKGTLDATQSIVTDGLSTVITLTCQNFFFTDKDYSFNCNYHSSLGNTDVQLKFNSKH